MKLNQLIKEDVQIGGLGDAAAEYYTDVINHLRSELRIPGNVKLVVHFNYNADFAGGHNGSTLPDLNRKNVVHMYFKRGLDRATLLRAVCHEAVHAEQIATGRLVLDIENEQLKGMSWEGQPVRNPGYNRNSEWELEAHIKEKQLLQSVIQAVGNLMI